MQIYIYILFTIALIVSLGSDILNSDNISLLSIILLVVFVLEVVMSAFYGLFYKTNVANYNIYLFVVGLLYLKYFYPSSDIKTYTIKMSFGLIFLYSAIVYDYRIFIFNKAYIYLLSIVSFKVMKNCYSDIIDGMGIVFNEFFFLGTGILIFFTCSFPLLYFFHSYTTVGESYFVFYKFLMIGNLFLGVAYILAALTKWKYQKHMN